MLIWLTSIIQRRRRKTTAHMIYMQTKQRRKFIPSEFRKVWTSAYIWTWGQLHQQQSSASSHSLTPSQFQIQIPSPPQKLGTLRQDRKRKLKENNKNKTKNKTQKQSNLLDQNCFNTKVQQKLEFLQNGKFQLKFTYTMRPKSSS